MEGSVFVGGAVVQWLRDELGLIGSAAESEYFAEQVPDNGGVTVVPAFTGWVRHTGTCTPAAPSAG